MIEVPKDVTVKVLINGKTVLDKNVDLFSIDQENFNVSLLNIFIEQVVDSVNSVIKHFRAIQPHLLRSQT